MFPVLLRTIPDDKIKVYASMKYNVSYDMYAFDNQTSFFIRGRENCIFLNNVSVGRIFVIASLL